jgi:hypothetical protein
LLDNYDYFIHDGVLFEWGQWKQITPYMRIRFAMAKYLAVVMIALLGGSGCCHCTRFKMPNATGPVAIKPGANPAPKLVTP